MKRYTLADVDKLDRPQLIHRVVRMFDADVVCFGAPNSNDRERWWDCHVEISYGPGRGGISYDHFEIRGPRSYVEKVCAREARDFANQRFQP